MKMCSFRTDLTDTELVLIVEIRSSFFRERWFSLELNTLGESIESVLELFRWTMSPMTRRIEFREKAILDN